MLKYISSAVFVAVIFFINGIVRPEWCNYHEQYQMFLFGWDYLSQHLAIASGIADYVAEFFVQFFFFPQLGAVVWATLLLLLALLVWRVARIFGSDDSHFPLAFLPSLLMSIYSGNQNVMIAFPVSIIIALALTLLYHKIEFKKRFFLQILLIPIIYHLIGYGVFLYATICAALDSRREGGFVRAVILLVFNMLWIVAVVYIAGYTYMRQYPFIDLFCGINFYRERLLIPNMQHYVTATTAIVAIFLFIVPKVKKWLTITELAIISLASPILLPFSHNGDIYTLLKIDYLVRNQKWKKIISLCEVAPPIDAMGYTGLNLALAKTNQLSNRMFEFPQCGQEGLISTFQRNMVSCTITGEVCYHLGLINTVQRMYFDTQEAILNCNKSGRFTHRIAECFLINGNYDVAAKYINQLKKTLFYSDWAKEAEQYLYHPDKVCESKRWATICRHRLPDNVAFSVYDMSKMLIKLYQHSPDNELALQYAMACDLLTQNFQHFVQYFPLTQGSKMSDFENVPRAYQEAFAFIYYQRTGNLDNLPPFVGNEVAQNFKNFINQMKISGKQLPNGKLYQTYWRYVIYK